jgi:tripartite-type tricarboxylate transporter receptor subunit TctC
MPRIDTRRAKPRAPHVAAAVALAATVSMAAPAQAQTATTLQPRTGALGDYPSRPIRLVNPYAPGGTVDIVARTVAVGLTEAWGQQIIVDNRPGAGTNIGTEIVARAQPDGYTLLVNASVIAVNPSVFKKLPFDAERDFAPIALIVHTPNVLAIHPSLPAKNVKELVDLARASPGKIAFGSSSPGGPTFLALALFMHVAKIDFLHVPYKGGGPAITDLLGGQVQGIFNPPGGVMQHVKTGRLRALAVTSAKRSEVAPELPTIAESGYPGYESIVWYGAFAPRGTPRPVVELWNAEINRLLARAETRSRFLAVGMEPVGGTVDSFTQYFRQEIARWGKLIRETGIRFD